ncbi:homoserine O-acetyltransferase [Salarchaeum sp. JOR-1]|uniref:homoserine O-acetyltransferase MetX n=1 Tax=Salarchaeum sp. JOR-1 TaxID=2599399 RepID=UPI001198BB35|nr:homoserine O-acetyltransferase [Salarchaeum sp. JOR-1]QDX40270.1 homoserine O-acetyltransferase [Salarchaeum sp. JOR-1]
MTVTLGNFTFQCGETVPEFEIAYETYGEFEGDNAVLVCHALTGSQHVASGVRETEGTAGQARAWWDDVVGPGKAIDTNDYFVVCANVPGSCYGTTGPASENPEGDHWGTDFPPVTVGDWTRAQRQLLDELGVGRLLAVVGGSVGGMNALDWAKRYPDDVHRIAAVATAPRLDAQCLGLDAVARRAITTDPDWQGGDYYGGEEPTDGLAIARQLGHLMYLSKDSMERKFGRRSAGREGGRDRFPSDPAGGFFPYREVESYLDYNASQFTERFDANSYLYLTRAMDDYDLANGYGSDADALAAFTGEALVMSFTGDWHFTVEQSRDLEAAFEDADVPVTHRVVDSDHGHDAFLVEPENVGPPLRSFLDSGVSTDGGHAPVHNSLFPG